VLGSGLGLRPARAGLGLRLRLGPGPGLGLRLGLGSDASREHLGIVLEEGAGLLQCLHPKVARRALDPVRVLSHHDSMGHARLGSGKSRWAACAVAVRQGAARASCVSGAA